MNLLLAIIEQYDIYIHSFIHSLSLFIPVCLQQRLKEEVDTQVQRQNSLQARYQHLCVQRETLAAK